MKVEFIPHRWTRQVEDGLSRALPNPIIRDIIAQEVVQGVAKLYECKTEQHHAWMVTRFDRNPDELVIVAFEGSGMQTFGKYLLEVADATGVPLRAHVTSPIVERLLRKLKLKTEERVLRYRPKAAA